MFRGWRRTTRGVVPTAASEACFTRTPAMILIIPGTMLYIAEEGQSDSRKAARGFGLGLIARDARRYHGRRCAAWAPRHVIRHVDHIGRGHRMAPPVTTRPSSQGIRGFPWSEAVRGYVSMAQHMPSGLGRFLSSDSRFSWRRACPSGGRGEARGTECRSKPTSHQIHGTSRRRHKTSSTTSSTGDQPTPFKTGPVHS